MTQRVNFIDGLDGLAAGVVAIAAAAFTIYAQRLSDGGTARAGEHRAAAGGDRLRGLPRLPAAQLPPGEALDGRQRRVRPRVAHGGVDARGRRPNRRPVQRSDLLLLRAVVHPALHPRRADPRRRAGRSSDARTGARASATRRHRALPPSPDAARPRPAPIGPDPVDLDGAALRHSSSTRRSASAVTPSSTRSCRSRWPASVVALYTLFHPGVRDKSRTEHPSSQWQEKAPTN